MSSVCNCLNILLLLDTKDQTFLSSLIESLYYLFPVLGIIHITSFFFFFSFFFFISHLTSPRLAADFFFSLCNI